MTITNFFSNRNGMQMTIKIFVLAFLTLLMLFPHFMILELVKEREHLNGEVNDEVARSWARDQLISGPFLTIPFLKEEVSDHNHFVKKQFITILPDNLRINGQIQTITRSRSLYDVLLYESDLQVTGSFAAYTPEIDIHPESILWNEATLTLGISDPRGIKEQVIATIYSTKIRFLPGTDGIAIEASPPEFNSILSGSFQRIFGAEKITETGLHLNLSSAMPKNGFAFSIPLKLKGSRGLYFSPTATNCSITLSSGFENPSFAGAFLPEHRIGKDGFQAQWNILEYNKSFANRFPGNRVNIGNSLFGVNIQSPISYYTMTYRACKYMILFIIVMFLAIFITEVTQKVRIHVFQYSLTALSLVIFFALLLSLSEFTGFNIAYVVSYIAVGTMIYLYSRTIFNAKKSAFLLTTLATIFYVCIFLIIHLEKTALLFGALMLFALLAATMFLTRRIRWYEDHNDKKDTFSSTPSENESIVF